MRRASIVCIALCTLAEMAIGLSVKFAHDRDIARGLSFVLIANKMAASSSRFASLNEDEFEEILLHKDADNTRKATQGAATLFRSYLGERGQNQEFEKLDKTPKQRLRRC